MVSGKRWIVTTSGDRSLNDIQTSLSKSGFAIDQVLGEIGCITGSASDDVAKKLRGMPGVADVSADSPINIGPPDAPTTW
ncbi:MAG: hypothetical protein ACKV2Q_25160 [Planctomycetaceae bacterium]